MAVLGDDIAGLQKWVFSEEELLHEREEARAAAAEHVATLTSDPKLLQAANTLGLEDCCRLVLYYAQKLPDLCELCRAPSEVRWTATVFYRRFFAVRSPMEFDPAPMMFAVVHLACKVEEVHEITLNKLLDASGLSEMLPRVASLELPLLSGIAFRLLVEPKPDTALRVLTELMGLEGSFRDQVLSAAEEWALQLCIRTDAVLRWPISVILAASLQAALEDVAAKSGNAAGKEQHREALAQALGSDLQGGDEQLQVVLGLVAEVLPCIRGLACTPRVDETAVKDSVKAARKCQKLFERQREEVNSMQRKRKSDVMSAHAATAGGSRG